MSKTKNPTQRVSLRLSVNLSLDDVGLTRLYKELRDIETGASGLAPIQVHALKRRHLLKILHNYCAVSEVNQKSAGAKKPILTSVTQLASVPASETMHQEHPPPMINSEADRALLDIGLGFKSQT